MAKPTRIRMADTAASTAKKDNNKRGANRGAYGSSGAAERPPFLFCDAENDFIKGTPRIIGGRRPGAYAWRNAAIHFGCRAPRTMWSAAACRRCIRARLASPDPERSQRSKFRPLEPNRKQMVGDCSTSRQAGTSNSGGPSASLRTSKPPHSTCAVLSPKRRRTVNATPSERGALLQFAL